MTILNQILYVQGLEGLYYLKGQSKGGIVVANIQTGARVAVGHSKMFTCLGYVTIEAKSGPLPLYDVFVKMRAAGNVISEKSEAQDLFNYFQMIVPDYLPMLMRASDIAKIIKWFSILDPMFEFTGIGEKA